MEVGAGMRAKILTDHKERKIAGGNTDIRVPWHLFALVKPAPDAVFYLTDGQTEGSGVSGSAIEKVEEMAALAKQLPPTTTIVVIAFSSSPTW